MRFYVSYSLLFATFSHCYWTVKCFVLDKNLKTAEKALDAIPAEIQHTELRHRVDSHVHSNGIIVQQEGLGVGRQVSRDALQAQMGAVDGVDGGQRRRQEGHTHRPHLAGALSRTDRRPAEDEIALPEQVNTQEEGERKGGHVPFVCAEECNERGTAGNFLFKLPGVWRVCGFLYPADRRNKEEIKTPNTRQMLTQESLSKLSIKYYTATSHRSEC